MWRGFHSPEVCAGASAGQLGDHRAPRAAQPPVWLALIARRDFPRSRSACHRTGAGALVGHVAPRVRAVSSYCASSLGHGLMDRSMREPLLRRARWSASSLES